MIEQYFCTNDSPYIDVVWTKRNISTEKGTTLVVEAPNTWSDLAVKISATKYFTKEETSVRQLIDRVANFIVQRGVAFDYFDNATEANAFRSELCWLLVNQYGAFNSPVWFNAGIKEAYGVTGKPHNYHYDLAKKAVVKSTDTYSYPQTSACFIQSVEDSMDDIMRLAKSEAMLFKHGSGTGTNLSTLRSSKEKLSSGGSPSGPLSFMRVFDEIARVVKSGGRVRRAALLRALNANHPDIMEFIKCKVAEEKKAQALIAQGYDGKFDGEAYNSVQYQNANHSVRATDAFMTAVETDAMWETKSVTTNEVIEKIPARKIYDELCDATRLCGDPGMQFHDTINRWHTCANTTQINGSNPCLSSDTLLQSGIEKNGRWKYGSFRVCDLATFDSIKIWDGEQYVVGKVWKTGHKDTITVYTERGNYVRLTPDHKILTNEGWCEAKDTLDKYIFTGESDIGETGEKNIALGLDFVKSILPSGMDDVYDFTCPTTHLGIADGIVVHNCSEYMFIDDSACNLASLNLSKFTYGQDTNYDDIAKAVQIFIIAQDILVDAGSYPEINITENSHNYRPLGLGYCDLGAVLMKAGIPYDSEAATTFCNCITSFITAQAYKTSIELAKKLGTFEKYNENRNSMLSVIKQHFEATQSIKQPVLADIWASVYQDGLIHGFRNSQVTVLAPTGTIGFMMDCNTTGIEPELALIKYKSLIGGETLTLVNDTVLEALQSLKYSKEDCTSIVEHINATGTVEGSVIKNEHLPVFDCAFKSAKGTRSLSWKAHINMMAAAQPFLSGAISKTVNMPKGTTTETIKEVYMTAWKRGLKAVAIFVDECKANQPLNTTKQTKKKADGRRRLPDTRQAVVHKFQVGGHEGYLTCGLYEDGSLGELFINISKEGSIVHGLLDALATQVSISLQYGVPLSMVINKFMYTSFEPAGLTRHKDIKFASSILDYIGKWLKLTFLDNKVSIEKQVVKEKTEVPKLDMPTRVCPECGGIATANGSCYRCNTCGNSLGCS